MLSLSTPERSWTRVAAGVSIGPSFTSVLPRANNGSTREPRMPAREAQPHCTSRPGRHDVEADAPSVVPLRQRATAWYCSKTVDLEVAFVKA